jgi:mono/diheme cytochrome c family protein
MISIFYGERRMKRIVLLASLLAGWSCGSPASAGESALIVVPFAVPVAVPVAVVQQPTLFYGVNAYAPPVASSPSAVVPATSVTTAMGPTSPVDDPLRTQVAAILSRRCAECHRASQSQGDLVLFDVDGRLLDKLPRQLVVEQATTGMRTA